MSNLPVLEYGLRRRTPWRRTVLWSGLCAIVLGGLLWGYVAGLRPWLERRARERQDQQQLAKMLNHQPNRSFPVAAIALESALEREPNKLARLGQIPVYQEGRDSLGRDDKGDHLTRWQLWVDPLWCGRSVHYYFQHGTNAFLGTRSAPGGQFLVAVDITVNGIVIEFHGTTFDLATKDLAQKVKAASSFRPTVKLAEFSFVDDACYVLAGEPDANDPSAFTITVVHGEHRDTLAGRVQPDGSIAVTAQADPAGEDRWRVPTNPKDH